MSRPPFQIPRPFLKSCQQHDLYPTKLVDRTRYGFPLLQLYQNRFKERQRELGLFVPAERLFVPYWDVSKDGQVDQRNLKTEEELSQWLGDECLDTQGIGSGQAQIVSPKPDPQCRFIFLATASSVDPLEITPDALKRVLSYYQVMPCFPDFLYTFGAKNGDDREITRFSGFRTEKTFRNANAAMEIPALNRSGKTYQLCYTLKSVSLKPVTDGHLDPIINKAWRIRSAVIYHRFDIEYGTQLWIIGDPLEGIHEVVQEHIHEKKIHSARFGTTAQSFNTSLEMVLHYAQWATEEWRWHVQSSEDILEKITQHYAVVGPGPVEWDQSGLMVIQERERYLTNTITCLESNIAVMSRLKSFYTSLIEDPAWPQSDVAAVGRAVGEFAVQLDEYVYDISGQLKRANLALQTAKDRKENLLHNLNAQNAARQERYTKIMYEQQHKTGLDAIVMKVITVVTLIYLPMTFVSTFFSTDVVKYQPDPDPGPSSSSSTASGTGPILPAEGNESFSSLALQRFFTISIPLMVLTFVLAYGWYWWESRRIKKNAQRHGKDLIV
ncbi:hypothetical protein B0H67DRAFT_559020 [Lasiosphaeris hirsuta]|uniref:CorA-like transporter domain-containing protein n=1 Tax=Lasiosphaeris hirsuta TaxID=260670 RepID=A0AA40B8D6_9PEZI|nr:hypothetical protein B0H67DRAFT_559020 [Lasiosphaeris hirsuta]